MVFSSLLLGGSLSPGGRVWHRCPICGSPLYKHLFSVLWPIVSFCINCHPLPVLPPNYPMMSENCTNLWIERNMSLVSRLISSLLNKIIVVGSHIRPMSSPDADSWPDLQNQAWVSTCGVDLQYNQKVLVYPPNIHATMASMGISCHICHYCGSQSLQLGKIAADFFFQHVFCFNA